MFLAIINDTYSEVKEEIDNRREEFQVYIIMVPNRFLQNS